MLPPGESRWVCRRTDRRTPGRYITLRLDAASVKTMTILFYMDTESYIPRSKFVSDRAILVLKGDVKLQLSNSRLCQRVGYKIWRNSVHTSLQKLMTTFRPAFAIIIVMTSLNIMKTRMLAINVSIPNLKTARFVQLWAWQFDVWTTNMNAHNILNFVKIIAYYFMFSPFETVYLFILNTTLNTFSARNFSKISIVFDSQTSYSLQSAANSNVVRGFHARNFICTDCNPGISGSQPHFQSQNSGIARSPMPGFQDGKTVVTYIYTVTYLAQNS